MSNYDQMVLTAHGLRTLIRTVIGNTQDETAELVRVRAELHHLQRDNARLDREVGRLNSTLRNVHLNYHRSLAQYRAALIMKRVPISKLPDLPHQWAEGCTLVKEDDEIPF